MPNSAMWARKALTSMVRCRTNRLRARCSISTDCCSASFTGTNRIDGRPTASQIASASAASFLQVTTIGLDLAKHWFQVHGIGCATTWSSVSATMRGAVRHALHRKVSGMSSY
jgi:hypothetical protein